MKKWNKTRHPTGNRWATWLGEWRASRRKRRCQIILYLLSLPKVPFPALLYKDKITGDKSSAPPSRSARGLTRRSLVNNGWCPAVNLVRALSTLPLYAKKTSHPLPTYPSFPSRWQTHHDASAVCLSVCQWLSAAVQLTEQGLSAHRRQRRRLGAPPTAEDSPWCDVEWFYYFSDFDSCPCPFLQFLKSWILIWSSLGCSRIKKWCHETVPLSQLPSRCYVYWNLMGKISILPHQHQQAGVAFLF